MNQYVIAHTPYNIVGCCGGGGGVGEAEERIKG